MKTLAELSAFFLARGVLLLPRPLVRLLGAGLAGSLAPLAPARLLATTRANIRRVAPRAGRRERERLLRRFIAEALLNFYEAGRMHRAAWLRDNVRLTGLSELERALAGGRGVILLTAHLGNFPLILAGLRRRKIPVRNIGRDPSNPFLAGYFARVRQRAGVDSIPQNPSLAAARAGARWLAGGNALLLPADQFSGRGLPAAFFGYRRGTPAGPAVLARRRRCPVLPVFVTRQADQRHLVRIGAPLALSGHREQQEALLADARLFNRVIEAEVRACPEQWLSLFTRRFR